MDKELARLYRDRWDAVAEIEIEEIRSATMEEKLRQLNTLLRFIMSFQSTLVDDEETEQVRVRWVRLKDMAQDNLIQDKKARS